MIDYKSIVWSDEFLTGVSEIDEQHRILFTLFNVANAKLETNVSAEFLEKITCDLLSYALYHFETEEELMQEYAYPDDSDDKISHIQQHRFFSNKVVEVRNGIKAGQLISREDLLNFLYGWLVNHILNTDKKLGAFILAARKSSE